MPLPPAIEPLHLDPLTDLLADLAPPVCGGLVDPAAIAAVTQLHREILPPGGAILDLMSGWISHLPPEVPYARVAGVGGDAAALAENPFLDDWRVQDLNQSPSLPFATGEFDGAVLCVSVQHLTRPWDVIRDVGRVLRPGAPLVVTFSNCCQPAQPIACWRLLDDAGHLCLIAQHFAVARNWSDMRCLDRTPKGSAAPLYAVIGRSTGPAPRPGDD
jgi:SAM-dependent methyltransferase